MTETNRDKMTSFPAPDKIYRPRPTDALQIDRSDVSVGGVNVEDNYGVGLPAYAAFEAAASLAQQWNSYPRWQTFNHIEGDIEEVCAALKDWGKRLREAHPEINPEPGHAPEKS